MISKLYLKRALTLGAPVIASQLGFVLMGSTDTVMCGKVSNDALAAVGLGGSIYILLAIIALGFLFGVTSLVSIEDGANRRNYTYQYIHVGLLLLIPFSLVIGGLIYLAAENFQLLNQPTKIAKMASHYLKVLIVGTPFLFVFTLYASYLNGLGKTIPPMAITFIALIFNYFFNDILIFGKLGIPAYGFIGTAYASNLSRVLMCLLIIFYCYKQQEISRIRKFKIDINYKTKAMEMLKMGLPIGTQLFFEVFAFTASYFIAGWLGGMALAAHQIVLNISSVTFMFITGISTASNIMIGNGFGAKNKEHIVASAKACAALIFITELLFALLFIIFSSKLVSIYTTDESLILFASPLMFIAAAFQLSDGFQNLGLNMLRGLKDVLIPSGIALVCYWLIMIPLSYYFAMPNGLNWGIKGIWWGYVIGLSLASIIFIYRFIKLTQKIEKRW